MSDKEKEQMEKKRRAAKGRVTRTIRMLLAMIGDGSDDTEEFQTNLQVLEETYKRTEEIHEELVLLLPEDEEVIAAADDWIESLHLEVCATRKRVRAHIRQLSQMGGASKELPKVEEKIAVPDTLSASHASSTSTGAKEESRLESKPLPFVRYKLELPRFTGTLKEYRQFKTTFRTLVDRDGTDQSTKLHVLKGRLSKVPSKLICNVEDYEDAWAKLDSAFGRHDQLTDVCYKEIDALKVQRKGDALGFLNFAVTVQDIVTQLKNAGCQADLASKGLLKTIFQKLADEDKERWGRDVRGGFAEESVQGLSDWLQKESIVKSQAYSLEPSAIKTKSNAAINVMQAKEGAKDKECYCCQGERHALPDCPSFIDKSVDERWKFIKTNRCCFCCLRRGHSIKDCRLKKTCNKDGCERKHHSLLHSPTTIATATQMSSGNTLLPVIRVMVHGTNGKKREGNLLIDTGAQLSLIRKEFARDLGLKGKPASVNLSVVGGLTTQKHGQKVTFDVTRLQGDRIHHTIDAVELDHICANVGPLKKEELRCHAHLKDISVTYQPGPIDILLGVDYSHLQVGETRTGDPGTPVAVNTPFGWAILGPLKTTSSSLKRVLTVFSTPVDLTAFWETESFGVAVKPCTCKANLGSAEDRAAAELLQKSCRKIQDRYEIAMPWRKDPHMLPDNYKHAVIRLESTEKRLKKNPEFAAAYDKQIMEYITMGFARQLSRKELQEHKGPSYYIAHHAVVREDKASTPIRIVFDASAKFMGSSMNDFLMKGPDLLNSLFGVTLRFRENSIAVCADISKMFNQIKLPLADQHMHRFLWRNMDTRREPDVFMMERVSFGDKPAPSMAQTVLLRVAEDNREEFPLAAEAIRKNTYMDDICESVQSVQEAKKLIEEITESLARGGFKLKKWISNKQTLLKVKEQEEQLPMKDIGKQEEKILGTVWDPDADEITFKVKSLIDEPLTKRVILSRIAQIFDPIGLAAAFMIRAKIGMQSMWTKGLTWDEPISNEDQAWWTKLFQEISLLGNIRFSRCLTPDNAVGTPSLHIFCDASDKAFAACAYLRWEVHGTDPECRLVAAKTRVAPLKRLSIPRLELQAAVLGTRLAKSICQETRLNIAETVFWSDNTVTLSWIKSQASSYKPFVAVRIGEIQSDSNPSQWRHCPTDMNIADQASRGVKLSDLAGTWQTGPEFLKKPHHEWPQNVVQIKETSEERKKVKISCPVSIPGDVLQIDRFEDWRKLKRVTANVLRFIRLSARKNNPEEQDFCDDLEKAERVLIKLAQISLLEKIKQGELKDLTPFTDDDGIVRVGGRITEAPLPYDQRHPILLPSESHISYLLMKDCHRQVQHAGSERVLAESRQRYWIIRGRNMAKKINSKCITCRRLREPPMEQQMSNLPDIRLQPFTPPFYHTGVDYFGPITVKIGGRNRREKRYGALFTCLNTRAIHLELASDMSTPTFLQALRRFIARRGQPRLIVSDNGSNFVGAHRELRDMVQGFDKALLQEFCADKHIKWRFNTPQAPHHGGVFESMVKSAKKALQVVVKEQILTPEELGTYLCEVENLVNSRPLGPLSADPNDGAYITPNHLLIGRAGASVSQGPYNDKCSPKLRFKFVQSLVNAFWRRWIVTTYQHL